MTGFFILTCIVILGRVTLIIRQLKEKMEEL